MGHPGICIRIDAIADFVKQIHKFRCLGHHDKMITGNPFEALHREYLEARLSGADKGPFDMKCEFFFGMEGGPVFSRPCDSTKETGQ
jgi:hypothetical protein